MLKKIKQKLTFIRKILSIGANTSSKLALLTQFAYLNYRRYVGPKERPFSCQVKVGGKSAQVSFSGSMSELHTLVDIFVDSNYAPQHGHNETLFSGEIRTLLDFGANIGLASIWFALTYPNISIDAYEPNPKMFALLKKNLAQFPRVRVFEMAISSTEGSVTFNQSHYSLESSMFSARDSTAITVPATTIDSAITKIGGAVDFMKIDIEGSEFDALKAAKQLKSVQAIIGEAHTEQSGHAEDELFNILRSFELVETYNPNHATVFGFYAAHTSPSKRGQ